jgi:hypothetical protein
MCKIRSIHVILIYLSIHDLLYIVKIANTEIMVCFRQIFIRKCHDGRTALWLQHCIRRRSVIYGLLYIVEMANT